MKEVAEGLIDSLEAVLIPFGVSHYEYTAIRSALVSGSDSGVNRLVVCAMRALSDARKTKMKGKGKQL